MPKNIKFGTTAIRTAKDLGAMVRTARLQMGLTQAAGALLTGVGTRFLSELERGKGSVHLEKAIQVAKAFGIRLDASRTR